MVEALSNPGVPQRQDGRAGDLDHDATLNICTPSPHKGSATPVATLDGILF